MTGETLAYKSVPFVGTGRGVGSGAQRTGGLGVLDVWLRQLAVRLERGFVALEALFLVRKSILSYARSFTIRCLPGMPVYRS
jgi:hypothetical protein